MGPRLDYAIDREVERDRRRIVEIEKRLQQRIESIRIGVGAGDPGGVRGRVAAGALELGISRDGDGGVVEESAVHGGEIPRFLLLVRGFLGWSANQQQQSERGGVREGQGLEWTQETDTCDLESVDVEPIASPAT